MCVYFLYFELKVVWFKVFVWCMMNLFYICVILLIDLVLLFWFEYYLERLNCVLKKWIGVFYLLVFNIFYVFFKYMVFILNIVYLF